MGDADGVVQQATRHRGELPRGDLEGLSDAADAVDDFDELPVRDEKEAADGVEQDARVLPHLRSALALVSAEGEPQLRRQPEPVLLQRVGKLLGAHAFDAAGADAAAAAVIFGLEKEEEVVHPGRGVDTVFRSKGPAAREVAPELLHEGVKRRAGGCLAKVRGGEPGQHAVEVHA